MIHFNFFSNQVEKLRRELEAAVEALEQGRQELSSFAEQVSSKLMMILKITRRMKVFAEKVCSFATLTMMIHI